MVITRKTSYHIRPKNSAHSTELGTSKGECERLNVKVKVSTDSMKATREVILELLEIETEMKKAHPAAELDVEVEL